MVNWPVQDMGKAPGQPLDAESPAASDTMPPPEWAMPDWRETIWRGIKGRCPRCGSAKIFNGYLKVHKTCLNCAAPLGDMPADDAPPYIAMLAVLHSLALFILIFYRGIYHPGLMTAAFALLLLAIICMITLRIAKGAVVGILLKLALK